MSLKILHLIITRYNLHLTFQNIKKKIQRDEKWHIHRKELFKKYYVSSIRSHTVIDFDFKALVFYDGFQENLDQFSDDRLTPIYLKPPTNNELSIYVEKMISDELNNYDLILLTRCDNDDGIAPDYTVEILKYIKDENIKLNECLYFDMFVQHEESRGFFIRREKNPNILTFLNFKGSKILNPTKFNHAIVDRSIKTHKIHTTNPKFIQSIHDQNVGNKLLEKEVYLGDVFNYI